MQSKVLVSGVGILAVLATVSACGGGSASNGSHAASTIAIGFSGDFSGPLSAYGLGWRQGAKAYINKVNADGGVHGHQLRYVALDDGSDAARATTNAIQLVDSDHVVAISSSLSNTCVSILQVSRPKKVPLLCNGLPPDLLQPPQPEVYSEALVFNDEITPMEQIAKKELGTAPKSAAIYYEDGPAVNPMVDALKASLKKNGTNVVASESVPFSTTNAATQAAKISAANPDVIYIAATDQSTIALGKALQQDHFDAPLIAYGGLGLVALKTLKSPHFYTVQNIAIGGSPAYEAFARVMRDNNADPEATFAGQGYLSALIIVDALKKCGDPCVAGKLDEVTGSLTVDTSGLTSKPVEFSSDSHQGIQAMFAYKWDAATNEPVIVAQDLPIGTGE